MLNHDNIFSGIFTILSFVCQGPKGIKKWIRFHLQVSDVRLLTLKGGRKQEQKNPDLKKTSSKDNR